ncbi:MAG: hypothetical protein FD168_2332 [Desulfobulbaceae bacterium]|jgi:hypothetical protein|nr:MAG: hypothetical protein FD168_2332 [Desulfobulbaceae bacterium]
MILIGWFFVGKGFLGSPKKTIAYHRLAPVKED